MLSYRQPTTPAPQRPLLRLTRADGTVQDFVLPGVACDRASWLGWLPADLVDIHLATAPGFSLERVGSRSMASVLSECGLKRPVRVAPALFNLARRDERRFRDILRGACAATPLRHFAAWRAARTDAVASPRPVDPALPSVNLVLLAEGAEPRAVAATLSSLLAQSHGAWRLLVIGFISGKAEGKGDPRMVYAEWDASAPAKALIGEAGALGFLRPGDRLAPDALVRLAALLTGLDAADLVYADAMVDARPLAPILKPDWSPDLALVSGYPGSPTLFSRALVERIGPGLAPSRLAIELAAYSAARKVAHLPRILCRSRPEPEAEDRPEARAAALAAHLAAIGSPAKARLSGGIVDLDWPLPDPAPLVSIVIPSRDRLDLISQVTEHMLERTDYPALELVIVDNGSVDPQVLAFYERLKRDPRVRIEAYPHPFNFSAMTNEGVRASRGQVVVLMNNDIAVLEPGWLRAMVGQALRPEVGAVGAKLLYEDGRLQHAGVVVGLGGRAGHVLRRRPADSPGHLGQNRVAHEVAAVTAACLAVTREKYDAVGGLEEELFSVDFNDVDFCLRLNAAGWKSMWTPRAVLAHLESVSRGPSIGEKRVRFEREAASFTERWRAVIRHDPYYHPALTLTTFGEDLE